MKKQQSKQSRLVRHNDTCCSHSTNLFDRAETPKLSQMQMGKVCCTCQPNICGTLNGAA